MDEEQMSEALADLLAKEDEELQLSRKERAEEQRARRLPIMISHEERSGKKKKKLQKKEEEEGQGRIGLGLGFSMRKKVEFPPDTFAEGSCAVCLGSHSKLQVETV